MGLKDTKLNKNDNCLTYVFKRIGLETDIKFAKDVSRKLMKPFKFEDLEVGDVVIWQYRKQYHLWGTEIKTFNNKPAIVKHNEFAGFHFAVIEMIEIVEDGERLVTISECVRNENNYSFPTIKLSNITLNDKVTETEVRLPTYILDYKNINII